MILIFDLDDTLYEEASYVDSGLSAVAQYGQGAWGLDAVAGLDFMRDDLAKAGRGAVFDRWLAFNGLLSKARVAVCLKVYRHHYPALSLSPEAKIVLDHYRGHVPLYLVTDGHKIVQQNKIDALGLWPVFKRVFITHRFGVAAAKPSTICFEHIRKAEHCRWEDMVYVGDNPSKDFVGLNPLGACTVRVLTGAHAHTLAKPSFDAAVTIPTLADLSPALAARFEPKL